MCTDIWSLIGTQYFQIFRIHFKILLQVTETLKQKLIFQDPKDEVNVLKQEIEMLQKGIRYI